MIKRSYGIALCRKARCKNEDQYEILLVKKRFTYAFCDFIIGHYKKSDARALQRMFNEMAMHEKHELMTLDFNRIWYHMHHEIPENGFSFQTFARGRNKYNALTSDGGKYLAKLINGSTNVTAIWEIPKGRAEFNELPLDAAMRELHEETSISPSEYTLAWNVKPLTYSYEDQGVKYIFTYYTAILRADVDISAQSRFKVCKATYAHELECVRWVSTKELGYLGLNEDTFKRLRGLIHYVFRHCKHQKIMHQLKPS